MPAPKGNKNAVGNKGGKGQEPIYHDKFADMADKACQAGFTDKDLADLFGVSERTINAWKIKHIEFASALKVGKEHADSRVERSLFARAIGYRHDAVKIFNHQGEIITEPYVEHFPPDTTACIFWLKNRKPADWRDKTEQEVSGNVTLTLSNDDAGL